MSGLILIFTFSSESDRDKFEYIFNRYKNLMLYKSMEILHDHSLAEDAVSEALIRIYKNIHKIEDAAGNKAVAFIITIVKNTSLTLLSQEKKKSAEPWDENMKDGFDLERYVVSELSAANIYALMEQLGEDLKSVFLLRFAYDMSHKEIGRILDISENNVTVRLHRAKKKLSQLLVKEGYVYETK